MILMRQIIRVPNKVIIFLGEKANRSEAVPALLLNISRCHRYAVMKLVVLIISSVTPLSATASCLLMNTRLTDFPLPQQRVAGAALASQSPLARTSLDPASRVFEAGTRKTKICAPWTTANSYYAFVFGRLGRPGLFLVSMSLSASILQASINCTTLTYCLNIMNKQEV